MSRWNLWFKKGSRFDVRHRPLASVTMLSGFHSFSRFYLREYLDAAGSVDDTGEPRFISIGKRREKFKLTYYPIGSQAPCTWVAGSLHMGRRLLAQAGGKTRHQGPQPGLSEQRIGDCSRNVHE